MICRRTRNDVRRYTFGRSSPRWIPALLPFPWVQGTSKGQNIDSRCDITKRRLTLSGNTKMAKEIPRSSQKRLLRLISARADVLYAQTAYRMFEAASDPDLRYCAFLTMVVSYGRPFTNNEGIGSLLCEFPDYPQFSLSDSAIRHKRMMDLRNKFLSHSSLEGIRVVVLAPNATDPGTGARVPDYSWNVAKSEFLHPEFAPWLHALVDALETLLDVSIDEVLREVGPAYLDAGEARYLETLADTFSWTPV